MKDKVAIVTGGTGGIGRASAIEFAKRGAKVVVTGRRKEEGLKTISMVEEAGSQGHFVKADVASEADCQMMVNETVQKFGRLDYAFNNAGIEGLIAPLFEQTNENFQTVMNINVLGVLNSMKFQVPAMLKSGGGAVVNNASVASMIGMPGISVYSASKHAVIGLTKVAALELAKEGVRVNAVSPAAIKTDMFDRFTGGDATIQDQLGENHPVGRAGNSEEIASAVCYLCSEGASFITGVNLPVDGGFTSQ